VVAFGLQALYELSQIAIQNAAPARPRAAVNVGASTGGGDEESDGGGGGAGDGGLLLPPAAISQVQLDQIKAELIEELASRFSHGEVYYATLAILFGVLVWILFAKLL
jgi:hypothetical protein